MNMSFEYCRGLIFHFQKKKDPTEISGYNQQPEFSGKKLSEF